MKKRGISPVIATLFLIVLSLVAIGIMWGVIKNTLDSGKKEISIEQFTLSMNIKKVLIKENSIDVTVERNPGKGKVEDLTFAISSGSNSKSFTIQNTNLKELETKTFNIPYSGIVKKISMAPSSEGKIGKIMDTIEFTSEKAIENMNILVSWWRFEGNTNDETGLNEGTNHGAILIPGKHGQAYDFDGADDTIEVPYDNSLNLTKNLSIGSWIYVKSDKPEEHPEDLNHILSRNFHLYREDDNDIQFTFQNESDNWVGVYASNAVPLNTWVYVTVTLEKIEGGYTGKMYINGNLESTSTLLGNLNASKTDNLFIGSDHGNTRHFNGTIDEVVMFNSTLSDQQIKDMYNLEF